MTRIAIVAALLGILGCGAPRTTQSRCHGSVSGAVVGSFGSCDANGEVVADSTLSISTNDYLGVSYVSLFFKLIDPTPAVRTYHLSELSMASVAIQVPGQESGWVVQQFNPAQPHDQGDATITFTSVTPDGLTYQVHGTIDATVPSDQVATTGSTASLHVVF